MKEKWIEVGNIFFRVYRSGELLIRRAKGQRWEVMDLSAEQVEALHEELTALAIYKLKMKCASIRNRVHPTTETEKR